MIDKRTEVLRLADALDAAPYSCGCTMESAAQLRRLSEIEVANQVWSEKTQWLEATAQPHELGMHRADVMKQRIDSLEAQREELLEALKRILQTERGTSGRIIIDRWLEDAIRDAIAKTEGKQ